MNSRQTYNLIGLCMRAGLCRSGTEVCREEIRSNRSQAVIMSSSLARDARSKLEALCKAKNVTIVEIDDESGALGESIGRPGVKTLSIQDRSFACRIIESIQNDQKSRNGGGA
ncbi:MAG: L7Ae/L30e/S12e/Gadd45 family ribosomal protein [Bacillota bacterium]